MAGVYLDSNVVIWLTEGAAGKRAAVVARLRALGDRASYLVVSDLVRLESRVKPLASGDGRLLLAYDTLFASPKVSTAAFETAVFDRATDIRARYGFQTADALHLAAAIEAGCDLFVTADRKLAAFGDIEVLLVTLEQDG